jgi:hypothetical protein
MRKSIISSIVVGLSLAFVGCPPPADNGGGDTGTETTSEGGETTTEGGETTTEGGESQPADGGETATDTGGETAAPASTNADLSHVKVGQKYHYEMQNNMTAIWEVTEVAENMVKYTMTMMMDMGQGPAPVGDPQEQTWKYEAPSGETTGETTGETPETSREEVEVSGIKFDCLVSESDAGGVKSKSWVTMTPGSDSVTTFPGIVKAMTDGNPSMTLVKVE